MRRRTFVTLAAGTVAAALVFGGNAAARDFSAYRADSFRKLLSAGDPVVVHVHAEWCAICRRQISILNEAFKAPEFKKVRTVRVNFDKERQFLSDHRVVRQATILVFRGGKEVSRIVYDTDEGRIKKTLATAL